MSGVVYEVRTRCLPVQIINANLYVLKLTV